MKNTCVPVFVAALLIVQVAFLLNVLQRSSAYTPHQPIMISGNSGFNSSNGVVGGNGTQSDPFIIEGWDIDASSADAIRIQGTDAWFVIRDVSLHSGSSTYNGISMQDVVNGRIENSTFLNNSEGIRLWNVTNAVITSNQVSDNYCGMEIGLSDQITITDNNASGNRGIGILVYSTNVTVAGNEMISNALEGLYLGWGAKHVVVSDNDIEANKGAGVKFEHSLTDATVKGNIILSNKWGIFDNGSSHLVTISKNRVYYNNDSGLELYGGSDNITIMYNNISSNVGYGVRIWGSGGYLVHHNNFVGNTYQALDMWSNLWDNGCPSGGNYWSNYTGVDSIDCRTGSSGQDGFGDSPFIIDSDSQDTYPLMEPVRIATNNTPPEVHVLGPNGGEDWTGNTVHDIAWTMYDDYDTNLIVWIDYSANGGSNWTPIPGAQGMNRTVGSNSFQWTVPAIDTTTALVRVKAMDSNQTYGSDQSDATFTIDSVPPHVLTTDPANGTFNVSVSTNITILFSENMNQNSVFILVVPNTTMNRYWLSPSMLILDPNPDLGACSKYDVGVDGKDDSDPGNAMNGPDMFWFVTQCGNNTPPSVSVLKPLGGEDWAGGFTKDISWNVSDPDDPPSNITVDLHCTTDSGQTWNAIALSLPGNVTSYQWPVPTVNSTTSRVRVCAKDSANQTDCRMSGYFKIDSAPPQVSTTGPPSGATNVSRFTSITVTWNEQMNNTKGSFNLTPQTPGSVYWYSANASTFVPATPLDLCTNYSVSLSAFTDVSDPGNQMAGTYAFHFTTVCPGPPTVNLTRPVGGEYWAGGSGHLVEWTAIDAETPLKNITFYVNYTSSVSSGKIAGPLLGSTFVGWTLPQIDANDVQVNITAIDSDGNSSWDVSGFFTIDSTPPSIQSYSPTDWDLQTDIQVHVAFSEPVNPRSNLTATAFGLREGSSGKWVSVLWISPPPAWQQQITFVPNLPLRTCDAYNAFVNSTFTDRALWNLSNPATWTFHTICPPTVTLNTVLTGKDWTGGSKHDVSWSMNDNHDTQLRFWMNYSRNGGVDGFSYLVYSNLQTTGTVTYSWTLPLIDANAARIRITVMDTSGLRAVAESGSFTIDSTPPAILITIPIDGSSGVKNTDTVQVVFTEPINKSSAQTAFSISPDPGDVQFSWEKTTLDQDIMVVKHKPFTSKKDYRVTFSTLLHDLSDPGNHPASALTFHFTTKPPPPVNPPVALAVGKNQVAVGELVTFDGSGSSGNISKYVWIITDRQGSIKAVLEGMKVTYTFNENGRYTVILRVIDSSTGLDDVDTLEIAVTSSVNAGVVILLSSALIASAAIGGTEIGRMALFALLAVPAYRRKMKGKEDPETRGMVKGYILVHPGDTYTEIRENLGMNNGSLMWHLSKLEKDEVIKSQIDGTHRRYYPTKMPLPVGNGGQLHEIQRRMLKLIEEDPGLSVRVLAEEMGISSQRALYHLRKLSQKGIVMLERRALRLRVYPPQSRNT